MKESIYFARISLFPPSAIEITPFSCFATRLTTATCDPGLHVLENGLCGSSEMWQKHENSYRNSKWKFTMRPTEVQSQVSSSRLSFLTKALPQGGAQPFPCLWKGNAWLLSVSFWHCSRQEFWGLGHLPVFSHSEKLPYLHLCYHCLPFSLG